MRVGTCVSMIVILVWAMGWVLPEAWAADDASSRRTVAILAFEGVELLDFAGPAEVFAAASHSTRAYDVRVVGVTRDPIISQGLVKITPTHSIEQVPRPDILVIPGGGVRSVLSNEAWMSWIRECGAHADIMASVCNGALVLAQLGLLDQLEATTHHGSIQRLREMTKDTVVHENVRFVDNGRIVTAAGISAGIDMSLYLIARENDERSARSIARYMEYPFPDIENVPGKRGGEAPTGSAALEGDGARAGSRDTTPAIEVAGAVLGGLDPVALVCGERVPGTEQLVVEESGYRYAFANERNREVFLASPGRYRIEYQGTCAGMRGGAGAGSGDPARFKVYGGRIYLFAGPTCQADFETDPDDFVAALERSRIAQME